MKDGLTTEEMFPYLQRVLDEAKNWMIHSTGNFKSLYDNVISFLIVASLRDVTVQLY